MRMEVPQACSDTHTDQVSPVRSPEFEDLPWEWSGAGPVPRMRNDRFQLLLISHEVSRSGSPLLWPARASRPS